MLIFGILKFFLGIAAKLTSWVGQLGEPNIPFTMVNDFIDGIDVALYLFPLYKLETLLLAIIFFSILRILIAILNEAFLAIPMY